LNILLSAAGGPTPLFRRCYSAVLSVFAPPILQDFCGGDGSMADNFL
jgi:hypothetical protein